MTSGVVLLAAGSGRRFGAGRPKQFLRLNNEPLFLKSFREFLTLPSVREITVVVPLEDVKRLQSVIAKLMPSSRHAVGRDDDRLIRVVAGGSFRGDSVRRGVMALSDKVDVILVHDSARPLVTKEIISRVEKTAYEKGAAVAAWPLPDTLKLSDGAMRVKKTIPRKNLWLAQTPQGFRQSIGRAVLLHPSKNATDDVALAERRGIKVHLVEGSPTNMKVTYPHDLKLCKVLLPASPLATPGVSVRTGFGFDAHDYSGQGRLRLGGIEIPSLPQLKGHSDGDALLHAIIDALLGGAGLGDIGDMFPDTDARIKGIDSRLMLTKTLTRVRHHGFAPTFVDIVIMAEKPKVTPLKMKLKKSISALLGLPVSDVNIKAKTSEGTRLLSEKGGVAVWAVATLTHA